MNFRIGARYGLVSGASSNRCTSRCDLVLSNSEPHALMGSNEPLVRLDLNNPVFQEHLLNLEKAERNSAIDTLKKIRQLTWTQLYRDNGLKWEKIVSVKPPQGVDSIYSLRITQSKRCTAYRDGEFMRLLTVAPDHDSTYGKK